MELSNHSIIWKLSAVNAKLTTLKNSTSLDQLLIFGFSKTLRMPENTDQNNSEYGHFLRIERYY